MAVMTEKPAGDTTIRPFTFETPQADLEDLRARIARDALAREGDRRG